MKLRKVYIYLFGFIVMSLMFSACYYISYLRALNEFNKRAVERSGEYADLEVTHVPTAAVASAGEESKEVDRQAPQKILPSTQYILECYDKATGATETEEHNPPGDLVGLTREEVVAYLDAYMKDMTLSEFNKGLTSFELKSFSDQKVVLRKSYDASIVPSRYYVAVKNGYVVVYNSDLKSVYSYTQIAAEELPEEDRIALSLGIYVDSLEELYALLESYSS